MLVLVVVLLLEAGKRVWDVESAARMVSRAVDSGAAALAYILCIVRITTASSVGETESWSGHCSGHERSSDKMIPQQTYRQ